MSKAHRFASKASMRGCLTGIAVMLTSASAFADCANITNPPSAFTISADGRFSPAAEWSDIKPQGFSLDANQNLIRTCPGDPSATSYVYTALDGGKDSLYLLYDFLTLTRAQVAQFQSGQTVAQVAFPISVNQADGSVRQVNMTVKFKVTRGGCEDSECTRTSAQQSGVVDSGGNSFFDIFVEGDFFGTGAIELRARDLAFRTGQPVISGGLDFGMSPNSAAEHAIAELEVPLRIPAGFGIAFPGNGTNPITGLYSPDPKFWTSGFKNNPNDPDPPSGALNTSINKNASVSTHAVILPTAALALKQQALDSLKLLSFPSKQDAKNLNDAIVWLTRSLDLTLFVKHTERVFTDEEHAAKDLGQLLKVKTLSAGQQATITAAIGLMFGADRQIALSAIADAVNMNVSAKKLDKARAKIADGDKDAAKGKVEAINSYREAFELADS